jgi:hypothetical protein
MVLRNLFTHWPVEFVWEQGFDSTRIELLPNWFDAQVPQAQAQGDE